MATMTTPHRRSQPPLPSVPQRERRLTRHTVIERVVRNRLVAREAVGEDVADEHQRVDDHPLHLHATLLRQDYASRRTREATRLGRIDQEGVRHEDVDHVLDVRAQRVAVRLHALRLIESAETTSMSFDTQRSEFCRSLATSETEGVGALRTVDDS